MNARVVFSKKTREKINKGLTPKERGKLRWEKLEKANEDGRLSLCKNRRDVAELGGYTKEQTIKGYSWVHRLVSNGYLQEVHVSGAGRYAEFTYFINNKPNFLPFAGRYGSDTFAKKPMQRETKVASAAPRKIGEARWQKLEEASKTGELAKCTSRKDVALLAGYSDASKGRIWVHNLIGRGHLKEKVVDGVASYSIIKKPNYSYFTSKGKNKTPKVEEVEPPKELFANEHTEPVVLSEAYAPESKTKMTIKTDVATIEIESVSVEMVEKVLGVCVNTKM